MNRNFKAVNRSGTNSQLEGAIANGTTNYTSTINSMISPKGNVESL